MPVIIGIVSSVITALLSSLLSRIIGALGFGMIAFSGCNFAIKLLQDKISSNLSSLPVAIVSIFAMAGIGQCFSILFSALVIRTTLAGMDSAGNLIQSKWKGFKA